MGREDQAIDEGQDDPGDQDQSNQRFDESKG
jgi:hypothetical protein